MIAAGLSCLLWRELLNPTLPALPPAPTLRQRQFGMRLSPGMLAALGKPLPDDFVTAKDLGGTVEALRDATALNIFVNWRAIEAEGGGFHAPVPDRKLGGMRLGEALLLLFADQKPPLACEVDGGINENPPVSAAGTNMPRETRVQPDGPDGVLTITTPRDLARGGTTRVYDVRDLAATKADQATLVADLKASVAPGSWRGGGSKLATGTIRILSGQIFVGQTEFVHYDLMVRLNDLRLQRSQRRFAKRAGMLTGLTVAATSFGLLTWQLLTRRRRLRIGLCARCGYDLRASTGRCPECGTEIFAT